jgi:hypothetical protein
LTGGPKVLRERSPDQIGIWSELTERAGNAPARNWGEILQLYNAVRQAEPNLPEQACWQRVWAELGKASAT